MRKYGTLLIIDDEKDIGEILSELFCETFEQVKYFDNVTEALAFLKTESVSAILSDISMAKLSGYDMVVKLRSEGNLTPVIFLTGYASKELILSALRLGVSDVLDKPIDPETLIQTVDRVLEIEKRQRLFYQRTATNDDAAALNEKKILGLLQVVNDSKKKKSA
jgi:DNA-binding NtrC family response regulator